MLSFSGNYVWQEWTLYWTVLNVKFISTVILTDCLLSLAWAQFHKQFHHACTASAGSDVQLLRGTQLLPSSALAFWLKTRVGDMPAASSRVNEMPGTSAFLPRSCWAKSDSKIPVSTHFKKNVCEWEVDDVDNTKICLLKSLLWHLFFVYLLLEWFNLVRGIL